LLLLNNHYQLEGVSYYKWHDKEQKLCPVAKMCLAIEVSHCSSVSAGYTPGTLTLCMQWKKIYMPQD